MKLRHLLHVLDKLFQPNYSLKLTERAFRKPMATTLALLTLICVFSSQTKGLSAIENVGDLEITPSNLPTEFNQKVTDIINLSESLPGLKPEEFSALKDDLTQTWNELYHRGAVIVSGEDKRYRSRFVGLQAIFEHILASELKHENFISFEGFIHTPMPATPFCSSEEISNDLVDPSIQNDPKRFSTVKSRIVTTRNILRAGGILYVIYPQVGFKLRTAEQQKIYHQELVNYPNLLIDLPLECEEIPEDLIGATYIFKDKDGNDYVFAIKMTQAKSPSDTGNFGIWFGLATHPLVQERMELISNFMLRSDVTILRDRLCSH